MLFVLGTGMVTMAMQIVAIHRKIVMTRMIIDFQWLFY